MSFSPIDFIFIGCIGYDDNFCWVLRNFDFKPANEIFSKKGKMSFFQKTCFLAKSTEMKMADILAKKLQNLRFV